MRELWELAVSDAGLSEEAIELRWLEREGRTRAWYCPPGIPLPGLGETGMSAQQAAELSKANDKHRVGLFAGGHHDEVELAASMRHELQHAAQREEHGAALMFLGELLRQAVASGYEGVARELVQVATPMERQAHQASAAFVSRIFGATELNCGASRLLQLCGRADLEIDMDLRTVAFAALHRQHLHDRVVLGRSALDCADSLVPEGWAQLVANEEFILHSKRAVELRPSAHVVAEADKPGRPWLPVVTALLECEDFGRAALGADLTRQVADRVHRP
jgi:hypothetical protein